METRKLSDGNEIPLLGLGVWELDPGEETERSVRWALEAGYRHIDTAQAYGNEESVGQALRDSGVPREDVFITTKFFPRKDDPEAEAEKSLERLGLDQVDLYIIHWPQGGSTWAWPGMQRAKDAGYTRSIGVSNFNTEQIDALLAEADTPPVLNQVNFSPKKYRRALLDHCEEKGVVLEPYSTLQGGVLSESAVEEVAQRLGREPAQVALRWCVQRGLPVIPRSTKQERVQSNGQLFDFELSDEDMAALDALDDTGGTKEAREQKWW